MEQQSITLDGSPITLEELKERQKNTSIRIVEKSPGQYVTLQKLQG